MKDLKIVFADSILPLSDHERRIIHDFGCEVTQYHAITPKEILEVAHDADAILTVGGKFTRETIEGLEKCKVIARYGVGYDNVDVKAATEKGIVVTYVPVYCQEEVATLALTLMLACSRRIMIADRCVKAGRWAKSVASVSGAASPRDKVFGLVGFGSIARQVVPLIKPLGVRVIAYDPYINLDFCRELGVESVELDELLEVSDYVSLHVPLMDSTRHMIAAPQLHKMKKTAILINTGRGGLVDQDALCEALKDGTIAAAGLDVLEYEPPREYEEIFTLDNCITTGHIAAATEEAIVRLRCAAATSLVQVLSGIRPSLPSGIANPDVLQKVPLKDAGE